MGPVSGLPSTLMFNAPAGMSAVWSLSIGLAQWPASRDWGKLLGVDMVFLPETSLRGGHRPTKQSHNWQSRLLRRGAARNDAIFVLRPAPRLQWYRYRSLH